jgi:siroheme synthase (precorrin-2 oxidase/ferrochelatase)
MIDDNCSKIMAEAIARSIGTARDELDRAREEVRAAEKRVRDQRAKVAELEEWLARILEGVPMAKINAADKSSQAPSSAEEPNHGKLDRGGGKQ